MVKREGSPSTASSQPATKKKSSGAIKEKKKLVSSVSKLSTPNNCKESHPTWSEELPQGEYGKQCVEKWCLLAPYDNSITDKQWRSYFLERSELDHIHTSLTPAFERIERDELGNTSTVLRSMASAISGEIYGSAIKDEEEKTRLGRTSRGSIYLLKLAGVNDGTTPQTLEVQSRLYSPYGIGTSIDFAYYFHHLPQTEPVDFNTWLLASPRSIADSQPSRATESSALRKNGSGAPTDSAIKIFRCSGSTKPISTTLKSLLLLSSHLYGSSLDPTSLWISPQKFLSILLASSAVLSYFFEDNKETVAHVRSKKDFGPSVFEDENGSEGLTGKLGMDRAKKDEEEMEGLEDEMDEEVLKDLELGGLGGRLDRTREELKSVCVSWRGLILARRDWEGRHGRSTKEEEVVVKA